MLRPRTKLRALGPAWSCTSAQARSRCALKSHPLPPPTRATRQHVSTAAVAPPPLRPSAARAARAPPPPPPPLRLACSPPPPRFPAPPRFPPRLTRPAQTALRQRRSSDRAAVAAAVAAPPTAHPGLAGRRPLCHPITGHRTLVAVHVSITTIPSGSATAVRRRRRARASPAAAAAPSQALLLRLRRIPGGKDRWRTKYASLDDSAREDMVHTRGARAVQPCHRLSRLGARRFVWVHTVAGGGARRYFSRCSCR